MAKTSKHDFIMRKQYACMCGDINDGVCDSYKTKLEICDEEFDLYYPCEACWDKSFRGQIMEGLVNEVFIFPNKYRHFWRVK